MLSRVGPYDQAISNLKSIIATLPATDPRRKTAHELLGYAYEKGKVFDKAMQEYARFLAVYPEENEDRMRVRQRLMSLEILDVPHRIDVSKNRTPHKGDSTDFNGNFSEYIYASSQTEGNQLFGWKNNTLSSISGLQMGYTVEHNQFLLSSKLRLTEIRDLSNSRGNRTNLSQAYIEAADTFKGYSLRLGRQPVAAGSISRFDGASARVQLNNNTKVTVAAGEPYVGASSTTHRKFVGTQIDWDINNAISLGTYYNRETADSLLDRNAVGVQLTYRDNKRSAFMVTEYDTLYHSVNQFSLQSTWFFDKFDLFGIIERRRSPMLYGDIALNLGSLNPEHQGYSSVGDLMSKSGLNNQDIYNYISTSTPVATSIVFGSSRQLNKKWSLTTDIQSTNISTTPGFNVAPTFDPVPIQIGIKKHYSFDLHLRGENIGRDYNTTELVLDKGTGQYFATVADTYRFGVNKRDSVSGILRYDSNNQNGVTLNTSSIILRGLKQIGEHTKLETQYSRSMQSNPLFKNNMNQEVYVGFRYDF